MDSVNAIYPHSTIQKFLLCTLSIPSGFWGLGYIVIKLLLYSLIILIIITFFCTLLCVRGAILILLTVLRVFLLLLFCMIGI